MARNARMTRQERREAEEALRNLEGWNGDRGRIRMLKRRLQTDDDAQARDERKGRHKRSR